MSVEAPSIWERSAQRVKGIIFSPTQTWAAIGEEPTSVLRLFTGYVMILAAINPVCFTFGRLVFGERVLGAIYRPPVIAALIEGVVGYGLVLGSVWALARLIEALATPFGAVKIASHLSRSPPIPARPGG